MMLQGDIDSIVRVLKQFRQGYFTLTDEEGDQFIVARREEFERRAKGSAEQQLPLPAGLAKNDMPASADDVLEKINREIATYQAAEGEELEDDLGLGEVPKRKVRFEPLKGDLPPELQE